MDRAALVAHTKTCDDCRELYESRALLHSIIARANADERVPPSLAALIEAARKTGR